MAVETSMNSKVYYKNCLYIVCQSFSPCLDLQVNCRCISWTHQILLFFCFAAEIYFQPSFFPPVLTRRRYDLTPSKEPIQQQQRNNKDPIITLFGKRDNFIAGEPPLAADIVYLREMGILIAHLLVGLTNTPKYHSIFLLETMCCVESIMT